MEFPLQSETLLVAIFFFTYLKIPVEKEETINKYVKVSVHVCTQCLFWRRIEAVIVLLFKEKFCWTFRYKWFLRTVKALVQCLVFTSSSPLFPHASPASCSVIFVEVIISFLCLLPPHILVRGTDPCHDGKGGKNIPAFWLSYNMTKI